MSEDDRRDIGVLDPCVHEPDTGVVNEDHGVSTLASDVIHERVAVLIGKRSAVPTLATVLVEEDETSIGRSFYLRIRGSEVPEKLRSVLDSLVRERVKRLGGLKSVQLCW